jgi:hypothetical protein
MTRIEVEGVTVHPLGPDEIALLAHRGGDVVRKVRILRSVHQGPFELSAGHGEVAPGIVAAARLVHHEAAGLIAAAEQSHEPRAEQYGSRRRDPVGSAHDGSPGNDGEGKGSARGRSARAPGRVGRLRRDAVVCRPPRTVSTGRKCCKTGFPAQAVGRSDDRGDRKRGANGQRRERVPGEHVHRVTAPGQSLRNPRSDSFRQREAAGDDVGRDAADRSGARRRDSAGRCRRTARGGLFCRDSDSGADGRLSSGQPRDGNPPG